ILRVGSGSVSGATGRGATSGEPAVQATDQVGGDRSRGNRIHWAVSGLSGDIRLVWPTLNHRVGLPVGAVRCGGVHISGTSPGLAPCAAGKAEPWCPNTNVKTEHLLPQSEVRAVVYAVVRAGGRQEKVEVGTIITMDRIKAKVGGTVDLAAVLLVDGAKITSEASALSKVRVTAEVLEELRGPKIIIQKFKNKTGYKKRQGHRQDLTRVKITGIK